METRATLALEYNAAERHRALEKLVTKNLDNEQLKKYYRFRPDRWYGGIATADVVGCGLLCRFCWVSDMVLNKPSEVGTFYPPSDVAHRLLSIAERKGLNQLRVSGGEPTIGRRHLLQLLDELALSGSYKFILETNGVLIGSDSSYAEDLSRYRFLHVRVSLKGCNENEFMRLTGAKPESFNLQLKALQNMIKVGVECHPAVITSFSTGESYRDLIERLGRIDLSLAQNVEIEELILYSHVAERLKRYGLQYHSSHLPNKVPQRLI